MLVYGSIASRSIDCSDVEKMAWLGAMPPQPVLNTPRPTDLRCHKIYIYILNILESVWSVNVLYDICQFSDYLSLVSLGSVEPDAGAC